MKQTSVPAEPEGRSPAGADIRFLMDGPTGNMIHASVPAGQVNRATVHATVSEFWYILGGQGEIWRRDAAQERVTPLRTGVSIDIPCGTSFQYRCTGAEPLTFIYISMPPWPGDAEASPVRGVWTPTV